MSKTKDFELANIAKNMIEEMFEVKPGETVVITGDTGTDMDIVDALATATYLAGGKPLSIRMATPRGEGGAANPDLAIESLVGALVGADVWIELNSKFILYSQVWERALDENKDLRYLIVYDATVEQLHNLITKTDVDTLEKLLNGIKDMLLTTKKVTVTSERGTHVSFEMDPNHLIDTDHGKYTTRTEGFGTLPGYVNVVPKFDTMEGNIIFDGLANIGILTANHVEFKMEAGKITEFIGDGKAKEFQQFVDGFEDEAMRKISHMMLSFNPGVQTLTGSIVMDERIYGGVDFGFGFTSAIDAPPLGQPAKSHFDGFLQNTSIWFDDVQITDRGNVCHPDLKDLGDALLAYANK